MKIVVPVAWREAVAAILTAMRHGTILVPKRPRNDWRNLDPRHYDTGLYATLAEILNSPGDLLGKKHDDMDQPGDCYSFTFRYHPPSARDEIDLYTKLNLMPDGRVVIIYSAHP